MRHRLGAPLDVRQTLAAHRHGAFDPTTRIGPAEAWRATRTPDGPGTLHLFWTGSYVDCRAWGPGADWLLERVPDLLGGHDDRSGFDPDAHPAVARAVRASRGLRISRSHGVLHALLPTILGQRITGREGAQQWAALCRRLSAAAPGPARLLLPPDPGVLAGLPAWWFHPLGIEGRRAETLRQAGRHAHRLERLRDASPAVAFDALTTVPGIGPWTAAIVCGAALGDPDAVPVGDHNLPHLVSWALAGEPRGDDARMLELLEPFAGHRGRVLRHLKATGPSPPRFGPRRRLLPVASW